MAEKRTLIQKLRLAVMIALAVVVLIVAFQNMDPVETHILTMEFTMPQAAMMFGFLAAGFGLGVLWHGLFRRR